MPLVFRLEAPDNTSIQRLDAGSCIGWQILYYNVRQLTIIRRIVGWCIIHKKKDLPILYFEYSDSHDSQMSLRIHAFELYLYTTGSIDILIPLRHRGFFAWPMTKGFTL